MQLHSLLLALLPMFFSSSYASLTPKPAIAPTTDESIVLLYDDSDQFVSTGLLVSDNVGNKYLVGARHTFYNNRENFYRPALRLRHSGGAHPYSQVEEIEVQTAEGSKFLWSEYDTATDIGLLPLTTATATSLPNGLSLSRFAPKGAPIKGVPLIVVGGTTAMPTDDLREPVFIPRMAATGPQDHLGGQIVISASITPGNSGSSVFETSQSATGKLGRLLGIVSQSAFTANQPSLIGYVEPAYKISDLISRVRQSPECCHNPLNFIPAR